MVSALDSADGTKETPIHGYGPPGAPIVFRRVLGAAAGSAAATVGRAATGQQGAAPAVVALLLVAVMGGVILAAAAAAGTLAAVAGTWALSRVARGETVARRAAPRRGQRARHWAAAAPPRRAAPASLLAAHRDGTARGRGRRVPPIHPARPGVLRIGHHGAHGGGGVVVSWHGAGANQRRRW